MSFRDLTNKTTKIVTDNSPAILTAIGAAGLITTAYLTGKATFKAAEIIKAAEKTPLTPSLPLTKKEKLKLVWQMYLPAAAAGSISLAAIIGANRIGTRRAAAMTAAYAISERAYSEYKDKVVETLGKAKEEKVRDEIAQDKVNKKPPVDGQIIMTGTNEVLCLDSFSGRYFMSDMESLKKAQNDINYQILNNDYATVSNYYTNIGLEPNAVSENMGWNTDKRLDLHFNATLTEDNRPCMVVDFASMPIRDPWQFC